MEKFKLIDGAFSVKEAKDIITNLLEFKIQYHGKQNFSNEIRRGEQDNRSLTRMENLRATKSEFLTYLESLSEADTLSIFAEIQIKK